MHHSRDPEQGHKGVSGRLGRCIRVEFYPGIRPICAWMKGEIHIVLLSLIERIEIDCFDSQHTTRFLCLLSTSQTDIGTVHRIHNYPLISNYEHEYGWTVKKKLRSRVRPIDLLIIGFAHGLNE